MRKQSFVWKGVFRRYRVNAYFIGEDSKKLESFGVDCRRRMSWK